MPPSKLFRALFLLFFLSREMGFSKSSVVLPPAGTGAKDRLLLETPFLISHDAATGYLPEGGVSPRPSDPTQTLLPFIHSFFFFFPFFVRPSVGQVVNDWARTQDRGFAGQLECGSRGFDLRPLLLEDGRVGSDGSFDHPILPTVSPSLSASFRYRLLDS